MRFTSRHARPAEALPRRMAVTRKPPVSPKADAKADPRPEPSLLPAPPEAMFN